jgi:hypothetical protein
MKLNKSLVGSMVTFAGYDGIAYQARVGAVRNRVATLTYEVVVAGVFRLVTAYISDATRLVQREGSL